MVFLQGSQNSHVGLIGPGDKNISPDRTVVLSGEEIPTGSNVLRRKASGEEVAVDGDHSHRQVSEVEVEHDVSTSMTSVVEYQFWVYKI